MKPSFLEPVFAFPFPLPFWMLSRVLLLITVNIYIRYVIFFLHEIYRVPQNFRCIVKVQDLPNLINLNALYFQFLPHVPTANAKTLSSVHI